MRGNHDNGMCFQTMQLIAVAVAMVFVLCVTAGTIGALAKADDGSYMLQSSSATELMGDFGVICFDTLYAQTHLHSNFITRTLSANSNSGLRNSYGVYEEFYFENAERMCGCVSDAGTDMLYTGSEVRRADGGEIYIRMNDGSETKLDSPANVRTDAEIAEDGEYSKYADMADIQRKFIDYSQKLRTYADTEGTVDVDITGDMNDRSVSVNGSGLHVVSMDYSQLAAGTNPIYFEFPDYGDTVLLMNIDLAGIQDAVLGDLILGSKSDAKANDNGNFYNAYNRMYFNFYDSSAADGQFGGSITFAGRGFGTVIAPEAAVNLGHNWDGCVVSEVFSNGGEFHRVPGNDFLDEEPTTEGTTTEDTTTEDTTTEGTTTEDTTTEDTTTKDTTTEDTTTEDTTTEDTTTEDTTTEDTTTEDTTTEDTTTESTTGTTTEDTSTETTTGTTTESTTERTTWSTTGTTNTMTTTRNTPPGRHPDTGDRLPVKETAVVVILALMGSAGILIYKKIRK